MTALLKYVTALLEYIYLVLSDTGYAKPMNKSGFLKPLETPSVFPYFNSYNLAVFK